ncbi:hypothetical protein PRIPAC_76535 [Pristionchus pacificus]|uniref:Uncharacterized protein n=1 Tax=Pristionchus pacificus TaxID=54126 RepID=A0A2A6CRV4_PRIPA|nr:hypothetical protein PRIPAC_76535 [Pristionchus pacificus]|eukprot:PDM80761.1 hypothetical protein PRIPAC_35764 [Pristionchus pacificus]
MIEMVILPLLLLSSSIYSAPTDREDMEMEDKRTEMRDFIIFRFAMKSCEVPSECHDKILYALKERIPPNCDTAKSDLLNCLKKEIHYHRGSSDLPLDLDSICCSFPSSGPLCPEICKTSLRSISMTPLQIYNNIATHCSSVSFPGDSQISQCIEVARHIHSRKEKECKKTKDFDD